MRRPAQIASASVRRNKLGSLCEIDDDDEDNYSDEEIANDPDEGDDGTNKLVHVKATDNLVGKAAMNDDDDEEYLDEFDKMQKKASASEKGGDEFEESPR